MLGFVVRPRLEEPLQSMYVGIAQTWICASSKEICTSPYCWHPKLRFKFPNIALQIIHSNPPNIIIIQVQNSRPCNRWIHK